MELKEISAGLPSELNNQLLSSEKVYYFSYIAVKGGCLSSGEQTKYWIAFTNSRVIYLTRVSDISNLKKVSFYESNGILPFEKVSFIEVAEGAVTEGCSNKKVYLLKISTSGGTVQMPIPSKEKGYEIRQAFARLSEQK